MGFLPCLLFRLKFLYFSKKLLTKQNDKFIIHFDK